jgi:hypothetical protein
LHSVLNTVSYRVKPEHVVNEKDLERTLRIDGLYDRNCLDGACGKKKARTLEQRNNHGWTHICCLLRLLFALVIDLFASLGAFCNLLNPVTSRLRSVSPCMACAADSK